MRCFLLLAALSCAYGDDDDDDDKEDGDPPEWFGDDTGEADADTDVDSDADADADGDGDGDGDSDVDADTDEPPRDEDGDGYEVSDGDCDDDDPRVNPGERETCNGVDDDCDGEADEDVTRIYYADYDGDGFGDGSNIEAACEVPAGYVTNANDCDDTQADVYPGNVETCDDLDNDCDGQVDEGVSELFYADADGDGFGDAFTATSSCKRPKGYVPDDTDCDDATAAAFPGNAEVCDEIDNDCDGVVDEGVTSTYYADVDGDGYGNPSMTQEACTLPAGYAVNDEDCDDSDAGVWDDC